MQTNNYYSIYLQSVYDLAKTIVIKSDDAVDAMNSDFRILRPNDFNENDPASWKYYLNISGQYHITDTIMTVTSLDTLEKITFNKANLQIHRATARNYVYGTRFYQELVSQYPNQEMLILGILYPVDINVAIAAPDGKILGYPSNLVETNEYSFIDRLQDWVDGYKSRWTNRKFILTDDLYLLVNLGMMYANLPPAILAIRQDLCKTNEAHSFHVRQYLASHMGLDFYQDQMTLAQSLWFYRNILYIEKNTGFTGTFSDLVDHTMTERNLPIAQYTMRHDLTDQPTNLYPTVQFKREPLNSPIVGDPKDTFDLPQMLAKEDKLAKDNARVRMDDTPQIQQVFENSLSNKLMTKALESSMFDYSNSTVYSLEDILLNHWIYLSHADVYNAFIRITNPTTGEIVPLIAKEAFVFAFYIFCYSIGIELLEVPKVEAVRVQRIPTRSVDQLLTVVDQTYISRDLAEQALSLQPEIPTLISTEAFYNVCNQIYVAANMQRGLIAYQEHWWRRGQMQGLVSQIYSDNICQFDVAGKSYADWFAERSIKIDEFTIDNTNEFWLNILNQATGADLVSTVSLASLQKAMIGVMTTLSSYSVQFLTEINNSTLKQLDRPIVRVGDWQAKLEGSYFVDIDPIRVLHHEGKHKNLWKFDVGPCGIQEVIETHMHNHYHLWVNVKNQTPIHGFGLNEHKVIQGIRFRCTNTIAPNTENVVPVPGVDIYLEQSPEDRLLVADVYDNCYWDNQAPTT